MKKNRLAITIQTLLLSTVAGASGVQAQSSDDSTELTKSSRLLEEVVVTARRKEESLQSVPITIKAFDAESLAEKSINTTQDLQYAVPGIFLSGSGSRTNTLYSIRGQSKPVIGQGSPGVLTYFADVPLPSNASSVPQYDIGSIQVLKGPQGTLFGRNSTGGAILTYPEMPDYEMGGYVRLAGGDYNFAATQGAVNIPLVDNKAALRIAGQIQRRDGYTKNFGTGNDQDQLDSKSFRATLLLDPTDAVRNVTIFDYHKNEASTSGAIIIRGTDFNGFPFEQIAQEQIARGPRDVELNQPNSSEDVEQFGLTNRTDIELEHVSFTNIIGYRRNDVYVASQIDGMSSVTNVFVPVTLEHVLEGQQKSVYEQFTEEFQIKGALLDDKLDWLVGLFYLESEPDGPVASATGFFQPIPQTYQFLEEESKAVYTSFSYDLSSAVDGLSVTLGARKTWDESSLCSGVGEPPMADAPTQARLENCADLTGVSSLSTRSNATTWTAGIDWQVNDDLFAYLTTRKGYRAGGINGPEFGAGLAAYQTFDPEEVQDVELGLRSDWQAGDVNGRFNIALFQSDADDVQLAASGIQTALMTTPCDPVTNPFVDGDCDASNDPAQSAINQNVGETEIQGAEIELSVLPLDGLTLNFSATFLDSDTKSYNPPAPLVSFYPQNEIPILYTAEESYTAGVRYELPLGGSLGELVLNASYYYSGQVAMITYEADSYELTNLRADWNDLMATGLDVSVFVRNVFDEEAVIAPAALSSLAPWGTAIYNEPRMWGAEIQYRFGN